PHRSRHRSKGEAIARAGWAATEQSRGSHHTKGSPQAELRPLHCSPRLPPVRQSKLRAGLSRSTRNSDVCFLARGSLIREGGVVIVDSLALKDGVPRCGFHITSPVLRPLDIGMILQNAGLHERPNVHPHTIVEVRLPPYGK